MVKSVLIKSALINGAAPPRDTRRRDDRVNRILDLALALHYHCTDHRIIPFVIHEVHKTQKTPFKCQALFHLQKRSKAKQLGVSLLFYCSGNAKQNEDSERRSNRRSGWRAV